MKLIGTVAIVCLLTQLVHCMSRNNQNGYLRFAQTLCRHGDRNLYSRYPNDPWGAGEYWPGGDGELTNIGKQQHYSLGQYFRERYATLLGDGTYSANKVYVQSSDVDRCLMSAEAAMAGLFPPIGNQQWNDYLDWQPVPIHTEPKDQDYKLAMQKPCDRYDLLMIENENSDEYKDLFKEYQSVISYLEEKSGSELPTLASLATLYDALLTERNKGYRLPSWTEEVWDDLEYFSFRSLDLYTTNNDMRKLRSGYLLKEILSHFTDKIQSTLSPDRSLWMYFAHDTTILDMMNSFGLYTYFKPPTASCLLFELYQYDDDSHVQIFFRNSTDGSISELEIPECGTKCSLSKLYEIYEDILPKESYDKECQLNDDEYLPPNTRKEVIVL